jgi:23S rRNA (cytidine1920-2'-O)/16S rRNA (cytidine1409-2'-O)-methyltransferase
VSDKKRIDLILVERGLADSRSRAQELVRNGLVKAAGAPVSKPSAEFSLETSVEVTGELFPWVGRGGLKLDHALQEFSILVKDRTCLDLGASTGGFTDVLLQRGAAKVYAVDVGHGQLHDRLRGDPRVISLEGLHAKDLSADNIPEPAGFIAVDVSFISLTKVLPFAAARAARDCDLVALIKPQFEAGRGNLGKGGIVKDEALQRKICADIHAFIETELRWYVKGTIRSPVAGGDGNAEFLIAAQNY